MTGVRSPLADGVVLAHALANLAHGLPHATLPVPLALWQTAFVGLVVVAPLAGLWLVDRDRPRVGGWAVLAGGLASLAFGTYFHFLSATPDNVGAVTGSWSLPFLATAVGVSLLAAGTAAVGGWLLFGSRPSA